MIDFYYWPTPNGWKVSILLEELGVPYRSVMVDITRGEQFTPEFMAISPNHRMPAIVDHDVDGDPVPVFESGAIMLYLAERHGRFMPTDSTGAQGDAGGGSSGRSGTSDRWPGSTAISSTMRPKGSPTPASATRTNTTVASGSWNGASNDGTTILGEDYTIADMICWPWVLIARAMGQPLDEFPNVTRWRAAVKERPAVRRGVDSRQGVPAVVAAHGGRTQGVVQSDGAHRPPACLLAGRGDDGMP